MAHLKPSRIHGCLANIIRVWTHGADHRIFECELTDGTVLLLLASNFFEAGRIANRIGTKLNSKPTVRRVTETALTLE